MMHQDSPSHDQMASDLIEDEPDNGFESEDNPCCSEISSESSEGAVTIRVFNLPHNSKISAVFHHF